MKKLTLYLSLIVFLGFMAAGCTDLEEKVYSQVPVSSYGSTEAEINSLIAPIYSRLRDFNAIRSGVNNTTDMFVTPTRRGDRKSVV